MKPAIMTRPREMNIFLFLDTSEKEKKNTEPSAIKIFETKTTKTEAAGIKDGTAKTGLARNITPKSTAKKNPALFLFVFIIYISLTFLISRYKKIILSKEKLLVFIWK